MAAAVGVGRRLAELAHAGDPASLALIDEVGEALGLGLAAVINLLNPSRLASAGRARVAGLMACRGASRRARQHPRVVARLPLARVTAGERVVAAGALRPRGGSASIAIAAR
jgi:predicted NBD/HSP70 family sugar kinase